MDKAKLRFPTSPGASLRALWQTLLPGEQHLLIALARAGRHGYLDHDFIAWCLRVHPHGVYRLARHLASCGEPIEIMDTAHGRLARLRPIAVWCLLANHHGAGVVFVSKAIPTITEFMDWSDPAINADALFLPAALRERDPRDKLRP